MKKIVRLTERDLSRIVRRVIKEGGLRPFSDEERSEYEKETEEIDNYRDSFYDSFDFDYESAFPEDNEESFMFDDKLEEFIIDMGALGVNPLKAVKRLRKEPWFRRYVKYLN